MPFTILILASRHPNTSPSAFQAHYENSHIPLLKEIGGETFPTSHTRHYIQRNETTDKPDAAENKAAATSFPASLLVGPQSDFDLDAIATLVFDDQAAFQAFVKACAEPEAAERIARDEEMFLDRGKMKIVVVGDVLVTSG